MGLPRHRLGATALEPSSVVLGAMGFSTRTVEEDAEILFACVGEGLRAIDTAPLYGFGRSERAVGRVLARLSGHERPEVYTKVGLRWDDAGGARGEPHGDVLFVGRDADGSERVVRRDSRPECVIREVEASCERLGVERLDLVQVHQRDHHVPIDETLGALADLHRAGRVRAIGVSNFTADEVGEASRVLGAIPLASLQSSLNLIERGVIRDGALDAARIRGVGFLAYSPLAQGLLTGAHGPDRRYAKDDWRTSTPLFSARSRRRIAETLASVVDPIAEARGATRGQIALAWVLHQPGVSAVIAGASSAKQASENVGAATIGLSAHELTQLDRAFVRLAPSTALGPLGAAWTTTRRRVGRLFDRAFDRRGDRERTRSEAHEKPTAQAAPRDGA